MCYFYIIIMLFDLENGIDSFEFIDVEEERGTKEDYLNGHAVEDFTRRPDILRPFTLINIPQ